MMKKLPDSFITEIERLKDFSEYRLTGLDATYNRKTNYFIFIHEGLKSANVNTTGSYPANGYKYVIVVSSYSWKYGQYRNNSYQLIGMFNEMLEEVNSIPFGQWEMVDLEFGKLQGTWYDEKAPCPVMYNPQSRVKDVLYNDNILLEKFTSLLKEIWKFDNKN